MTAKVNHNVRTANDYLQLCGELINRGHGFFRGQTKDYSTLIPSIFRKQGVEIANTERLAVRLYVDCYRISNREEFEKARQQEIEDSYYGAPIGFGTFSSAADLEKNMEFLERLLSGDFPPSGPGLYGDNYERADFIRPLLNSLVKNSSSHGSALLQHYGIPSRGLDVSYGPLVALWFATHSFNMLESGEARYIRQNNMDPLVYTFPSTTDVQDLRLANFHKWDSAKERIPFFGTRGVVQEGGMIFGATAEKPDLKRLVSNVIHFAPVTCH